MANNKNSFTNNLMYLESFYMSNPIVCFRNDCPKNSANVKYKYSLPDNLF